MVEVLILLEKPKAQLNTQITAITNINKLQTTTASRQNLKEVQLQYDEAEENVDIEKIEQAVSKVNEHLLGVNAHFQYRIHEGTERIMIKLVDTETNNVIKEIPPEKMLDVVAEIWKRVGLIIDKQN